MVVSVRSKEKITWTTVKWQSPTSAMILQDETLKSSCREMVTEDVETEEIKISEMWVVWTVNIPNTFSFSRP